MERFTGLRTLDSRLVGPDSRLWECVRRCCARSENRPLSGPPFLRSDFLLSTGMPWPTAGKGGVADCESMAMTASAPDSGRGVVRVPAEVASCLKAAQEATAARRWGDVVERLAAMAVVDIRQHQQTLLATAREAGMVGDAHARCFGGPAWSDERAR